MNRETWGKPDPKPEKAAPKAPKPLRKSAVNKVSTKRAYENGRYSVAREGFLLIHPLCEACGDPATEIHHKAGRENHLLIITEDSAWAIAQGYSIRRNSNPIQS